jgi:hypothetical protein
MISTNILVIIAPKIPYIKVNLTKIGIIKIKDIKLSLMIKSIFSLNE